MDSTSTVTEFKPPYMSFQTWWNFLAELSANPLPPKLDRSIMTTKSGTDQLNLLAALEAFQMVRSDGTVTEELTRFADADADARKQILLSLIQKHYAAPLSVSAENGTPLNLKDSFRDAFDVHGDTQRKAITFFLHAAREGGIELSPLFPKTRSGSGAPGAPRKKTTTRKKTTDKAADGASSPRGSATGAGHTQTIELTSGGTVTLTYDVNMFEVDDEDQEFVLGLVQKLRKYRSAHEPGNADPEAGSS